MVEVLKNFLQNWGWVIKSIASFILPVLSGYILHILKNKADKKYERRSISLIIQNDIESVIKLANEYINSDMGERHMIFSDKLSDLNEWEKNLKILMYSLNKEESKQFICFYRTVSKITEIQERNVEILDKSLGDMRYKGNVRMYIPGYRELQDEFYNLVEKLVGINMNGLIKKLESI